MLGEKGSFRGAEYLYLYAVDMGKEDELMEDLAIRGASLPTLQEAHKMSRRRSAEEFVADHRSALDTRFAKAHDIWMAHVKAKENDDFTRSNLLKEIELKMSEKGVSAYSVCKELGINQGNFYAFLRGDVGKLSVHKLMEVAEHLGCYSDLLPKEQAHT